ncbi:RNA-binding S4 domain-containing protein [Luteolibacter ambystomatis]|uniref:RNA-binding S4 domain-containing protein n=1 Tax=Luteolibacter ambystomatis TaxID=2824561 RepID=A0A975G8C9_9BACT|nr:RNA-binding S4 domain-containing protein [Luteolibacter ambystomatis]QUE50964.1 RNA-binding S4 domain-containing protein [Luteolibacter ambystomatis]
MSENVRADKWLWATRFFKTRSAAAKACEGGKIKRAGHPVKPATPLHPGDVLEVPFHDGPGIRTITVTGLIDQRVGAPQAQACYMESTPPEVIAANKEFLKEKHERRLEGGMLGRPTKKDRRDIQKFRGFFE